MVAGVNLDRAWTDLGTGFGNPLRRWSRDVLATVVDEAHRLGIETIVIAGDLFDRSTVLPDTVDYAAKVLGGFRGSVLIAPGRSDWIGGVSPYAYQDWAGNTTSGMPLSFGPARRRRWSGEVVGPPRPIWRNRGSMTDLGRDRWFARASAGSMVAERASATTSGSSRRASRRSTG